MKKLSTFFLSALALTLSYSCNRSVDIPTAVVDQEFPEAMRHTPPRGFEPLGSFLHLHDSGLIDTTNKVYAVCAPESFSLDDCESLRVYEGLNGKPLQEQNVIDVSYDVAKQTIAISYSSGTIMKHLNLSLDEGSSVVNSSVAIESDAGMDTLSTIFYRGSLLNE